MTDENTLSEREIDDLLAKARAGAGAAQAQPSPGLLARIVADADAAAEGRRKPAAVGAARGRPRLFAAALAALGGWPAMAGLMTATVAGIWIGYASPDTLSGITDSYLSLDANEGLANFMPAFIEILDEG